MNKEWIIDTAKRVIWTMAEAALGFISVAETVTAVDWKYAGPVILTAGLVTALKCVVVKLKSELDDAYENEE